MPYDPLQVMLNASALVFQLTKAPEVLSTLPNCVVVVYELELLGKSILTVTARCARILAHPYVEGPNA